MNACCCSAAVAIPELGLYALNASDFSALDGMFIFILLLFMFGSIFVTKRWADIYLAYSAGVFRVFASYRF